MKNLIFITVSFFILLSFSVGFAGEKLTVPISIDDPIEGLPISIDDGKSPQVSLICDSSGAYLEVEMKCDRYETQGLYISLLRLKVILLTTSSNPVPLGNGYLFHYMGGYPMWSPSSSHGENYHKRILFFSNEVVVKDKNIYVWGGKDKIVYYPYPIYNSWTKR